MILSVSLDIPFLPVTSATFVSKLNRHRPAGRSCNSPNHKPSCDSISGHPFIAVIVIGSCSRHDSVIAGSISVRSKTVAEWQNCNYVIIVGELGKKNPLLTIGFGKV